MKPKRVVILVASPKGGLGKSTLCRCLIVCAAQAGVSALGVDFDRQRTFMKWGVARERARLVDPDYVAVEVREAMLDDWRSVAAIRSHHQMMIIDTPPALEDHPTAFKALTQLADIVLVPSGATADDVDSNIPWLLSLKESNANAVAVLYRVNRMTRSFRLARQQLLQVAYVAPVEIPVAEDMHIHLRGGLTALDVEGSRGTDSIESLWDYIRHETGITERPPTRVAS